MAAGSDLRHELEKFGLSDKQADIYLLLVARPDLRIQEIAELCHIPRSSVYESVRQLSKLGLVEEIVEDNFKKLRAYPPGVLRHALDEQLTELHQKMNSLDTLEQAVAIASAETAGLAHVRYYKGRTGARQVLWNTLKSTDTVYVYSEWGRQKYVGLTYYERFAAESYKRRITERVLINVNPETLRSIKQENLPGLPSTRTRVEDIRVLDTKDVHIKGDTLIYNDTYAQIFLKNVEIHGFEIESQDFVQTQRSIFETLWRAAKPVGNFL